MKQRSFVATAISICLTGCVSASLPPGKDYVSAEAISSTISGYTWVWDSGDGGLYFAPDGAAHIRYQGEDYETTWSTEDGKFCYKGPKDSDRCWALFREDNRLMSFSLWQREFREPYEWKPAEELRRGRVFG